MAQSASIGKIIYSLERGRENGCFIIERYRPIVSTVSLAISLRRNRSLAITPVAFIVAFYRPLSRNSRHGEVKGGGAHRSKN